MLKSVYVANVENLVLSIFFERRNFVGFILARLEFPLVQLRDSSIPMGGR